MMFTETPMNKKQKVFLGLIFILSPFGWLVMALAAFLGVLWVFFYLPLQWLGDKPAMTGGK